MKKLFVLATAALLSTGAAYACGGDKGCCKKGDKSKKECKKGDKKECKKEHKEKAATTAKPAA